MNGHCGALNASNNAPVINTTDIFNALIAWVEQGQTPATITGYNNTNHAAATVTRPICMHPNTLTYSGSGSIFSASSFTCTTQTTNRFRSRSFPIRVSKRGTPSPTHMISTPTAIPTSSGVTPAAMSASGS